MAEKLPFLTTSQAAELAQVSGETIRRWCREGLVESSDISGQTAVSRESLLIYLDWERTPRRKKRKRPAVTGQPNAKKSEIERNRALLNEKMSKARTAVLLDVDGRVVGRIERKS